MFLFMSRFRDFLFVALRQFRRRLKMASASNSDATSTTNQVSYPEGDYFLHDYRAISLKLKKRFLRRPNVSEASELFSKLSKRLKDDEQPEYEALAHLACARCENAASNADVEVEALVAAVRAFIEAHEVKVGAPTYNEHLLSAVNTANHAVNKLLAERDDSIRAGALCAEVAVALRKAGNISEALEFHKRSAEIRQTSALEYLHQREAVGECYLDLGDDYNALEVFSEVAEVAGERGKPPIGAYADILARCEVYRVLLLLILEATPTTVKPALMNVLDKYAWTSKKYAWESEEAAQDTFAYLSEEVFYLLQSLVMAMQVRDFEAVLQLEDHLAPLLEPQPKKLLTKLTLQVQTKS